MPVAIMRVRSGQIGTARSAFAETDEVASVAACVGGAVAASAVSARTRLRIAAHGALRMGIPFQWFL